MSGLTPKPVYVLVGSDQFLRDEQRRRVLSEIVGDSDPQTAVSVFDDSAELATVLDELRTMPFLSPRRAVVIDDAEAFVSEHRLALEKYLSSPSANSSLVLMVLAWPRNTRLYKLVEQAGEVVDCGSPDPKDLPRWLDRSAARRGKKLAREAADLLAQWRGGDLAGLDGEIEKLSLYVGSREVISAQDVAQIVAATAGPGAYDLTNAIADGNAAAALRAIGGMLTHRGEEFRALGSLGWHLRKALSAQQYIAAGMPPEQACRKAGVFYNTQAFVGMLRRRSLAKLQSDFRRLLAADLAMKSGADAPGALQDLIVQLCL